MSEERAQEFTQYHKDGSIWAKGKVMGRTPVGYWEWFRKDGTKMRSGSYQDGIQVGKWTTYDKMGAVWERRVRKRPPCNKHNEHIPTVT